MRVSNGRLAGAGWCRLQLDHALTCTAYRQGHLVVRADVQINSHALAHEQVWRAFQYPPHDRAVLELVRLGTQRPHRRALQHRGQQQGLNHSFTFIAMRYSYGSPG